MFPPETTYDQVVRYLLAKAEALLLLWLLRVTPEQVRFDGWASSQLTLPGSKERICDGLAYLADLQRNQLPFACLVEVSTEPDSLMFGRLQIAGGLCWTTRKPHDLPGDRYELVGLVVNLTGKGNCTRDMRLAGGRWQIKAIERNLAGYDAGRVLRQIENQKAPMEALPLVSLMKRGDDPAIMRRWRRIAERETNLERRGDYSLAIVLAEAAGRRPLWNEALEGLLMRDSQLVAEWKAASERKGELKAKANGILRVAEHHGWAVPEEMAARIRASEDLEELDRWFDIALSANSFAEFRRQTGL